MRQSRFRATYSISIDRLLKTIRSSLEDLCSNRTIDRHERLEILLALREEFGRAASDAAFDMGVRREQERMRFLGLTDAGPV